MKLQRAIRLKAESMTRLSDLFRRAAFYGMTHESILVEHGKILSDLRKKRAPGWVESFLSGYAQAWRERWYEQDLVWCHKCPDTGNLYTLRGEANMPKFCESVNPLYEAGRGAEISRWESNHYWISASEREMQYGREPKPF